MDWITFIKWNGIVYATYYGANLLVDYLRSNGEITPNPSFIEYKLKGAESEEPKIIKSSDFLNVNKKEEGIIVESKPESKEIALDNQIQFNAPIERQGIPLNEFIKIATQSGNEIFQPTI